MPPETHPKPFRNSTVISKQQLQAQSNSLLNSTENGFLRENINGASDVKSVLAVAPKDHRIGHFRYCFENHLTLLMTVCLK